MNLLDVYNALEKGEIDHEQAATAFGLEPSDLTWRMSRHGHRLPLILSVLDKLKAGTITREDAAATLERSPRMITKLQETWHVVKPLKTWEVERTMSKMRKELCKKYALDFIHGRLDLAKCAAGAGVDERSMRRWVSKLLIKHLNMSWKEYTHLTFEEQKGVARTIEKAEAQEERHAEAVERIRMGKGQLLDLAVDKVIQRREASKASRQKVTDV